MALGTLNLIMNSMALTQICTNVHKPQLQTLAKIRNFEGILNEFYKIKPVYKQPFLPTTKTTTTIITKVLMHKYKHISREI